MKQLSITMTPTPELVVVGDSMCRVWEGETGKGLPIRVLVAAIASQEGNDDAELAAGLSQIPSPLAPGQELR